MRYTARSQTAKRIEMLERFTSPTLRYSRGKLIRLHCVSPTARPCSRSTTQ